MQIFWIVSDGWCTAEVSVAVTHADSGLVGGKLTEDVVSVGWTDPHLGEACQFLCHLIQQSPHLQQGRVCQSECSHGDAGNL